MFPAENVDGPAGFAAGAFATTHWSVVVRAGDSQSPGAAAAMERLCRTYWYPLYAFARRKGHSHEDACDLTQAFFQQFLEKQFLRTVDASLGKFRSFLLVAMSHFMANEWDRQQARRRGGGQQILSLEDPEAEERYRLEASDSASAESSFDRHWARAVMEVVIERLASEVQPERFDCLKGFLLEDRIDSYADAAAKLNLSVAALTSAIHRLRVRFRNLLLEEIARTVGTSGEVEAELRYLLAALSR